MSNSSKNLGKMLCLDIYLASCSEEEQVKLSKKIKTFNCTRHPLLSGDIYSSYLQQLTLNEKRKTDLEVLLSFQEKYNWIIDLEEILRKDYHTLVVTDNKQVILWANKNFTAMTGYPVKHAIGKTPRFLQGKNTSEETKKRIRQQLAFNKPFTETIINYRKNSEEYPCRVSVYPIANDQNETVHFLALESETVI